MNKEQLKKQFYDFVQVVNKYIDDLPTEIIKVNSDAKWVMGLEKEVMKLKKQIKELKEGVGKQ